MKEIKAYIRSNMADAVLDALERLRAVPAVAVVSLREFGHRHGSGEIAAVAMVKLEVDVADDAAERVVETIVEHARTGDGHPGDGKVFVTDLSEAVRIEDGTRGEDAVRRRDA